MNGNEVKGMTEQNWYDVIMMTLIAIWLGVCLGVFLVWR
jgi:hypothetical protein